MKNYTRPIAEIAKFDVADIITSSGMIVNSDTFTGANADMYAIYQQNSVADNKNVAVFTW